MFSEIMKRYFEEITIVLKEHRQDVVKKRIKNIITVLDQIFNENLSDFKKENLRVVNTELYGQNLVFSTTTSTSLIPYSIFATKFCFQLLRQINNFFYQNTCTINEFELFFSKIVLPTYNSKFGGYSATNIETLRFFFTSFQKKIHNENSTFFDKYDIAPRQLIKTYRDNYVPFFISNSKKDTRKIASIYSKDFSRYFKRKLFTYAQFNLFVNYNTSNIGAILLSQSERNHFDFTNFHASTMGTVFDSNLTSMYNLFFISNRDIFKYNRYKILNIIFFENYDNFKVKNTRYIDFIQSPLEVYYDFQDGILVDNTYYNINPLLKKNTDSARDTNLTFVIHYFMMRDYTHIDPPHPDLQKFIGFRHRRAFFYNSTTVFLLLSDPKGKSLKSIKEMLLTIIRIAFNQGTIIELDSRLLVLIQCRQKDFELNIPAIKDFCQALKLDVIYHTDLEYIPFSFYQIPPSLYYDQEGFFWKFPQWTEQPLDQQNNYLYINANIEKERKNDPVFKAGYDSFLERVKPASSEEEN